MGGYAPPPASRDPSAVVLFAGGPRSYAGLAGRDKRPGDGGFLGRRVTVNADDFGLCAAVNRAVARAHDAGALTSASLLANGPAFDEAVAISGARPGLRLGVHLNILRGRPVAGAARVPSLVDEDGRFLRSAWALFRRGALGRLERDELLAECLAQVERVRSAGLEPAHLDAEKHAHHWLPGLFSVVLEVARRTGIRRVRVVRERLRVADVLEAPRRGLFAAWVTARGREHAGRARRAGLLVQDEVYGVVRTGRLRAEDVLAAVARRRRGTLEVFAHPGEPRAGDPPVEPDMGVIGIAPGWAGESEALLRAANARFEA